MSNDEKKCSTRAAMGRAAHRLTLRALALLLLSVALAGSVTPGRAVAASEWAIYVNVASDAVTVFYEGTPVRAMACSTGPSTPRSGTYASLGKQRWGYLFGGVAGQYCFRIVGHILFHSVPYDRYGDPSALEEGQFDLLGTPASMGCVRLMAADAKWLYDNCPSGTPVTFYEDAAVASPLGKPYAGAISAFPIPYRGWDPTDPNDANPWNAFLGASFDAAYYLEANPDLQGLYAWNETSLRLHYLTCGIMEGRRSAQNFDVRAYAAAHPELAAVYGQNWYAYVAHYNATVQATLNSPLHYRRLVL